VSNERYQRVLQKQKDIQKVLEEVKQLKIIPEVINSQLLANNTALLKEKQHHLKILQLSSFSP